MDTELQQDKSKSHLLKSIEQKNSSHICGSKMQQASQLYLIWIGK